MSIWHDADPDDISLDLKNRQVDILVLSDDQGNVYVTLTFEQIGKLWQEINE